MRDIKFRAFNGKSRVMEIVFRLVDKEYLQINTGLSIDNNLMQFTGLHDKNGKEIYEGDVVKARTNYFPRVNLEGVVVFEDAEYLIEQNDGHFPLCSFHVVDRLTIEIIGNIHQNPELLEELA